MFSCEICGGVEFHHEKVEEVFHVDMRYILVEHIPASVCVRCGEKTFDAETAEGIRRYLHGEGKPQRRSVEMEVFAY
uniref:YgiT-type zinc finger domain-containing protein n=2 Tax=unclassified Candidatus Kentrum TaxID=2643149 RepID=A0A450ZYF5_9GAMM|nr:MAG: YgiT-type zinc finger domain-containing protein [Candidatus Kentron sp. LPFa]VFK34050.1 MAG: YgiT-type zinc finger domain-containing protein [Candidatus Kentron sp. LPFa]VFK58834.1 MAG: YgiT-type zinc finger domain-containing protein [Candidatus Kentron sp. UNK]VFK68593.1 MAG: YgiT-type zinc finger domain-containing protein [Candidatus Kentron sp. UNK]